MHKLRRICQRSVWAVVVLFLALVCYSVFMPAPEGHVSVLHQELFRLFRPIHSTTTSIGTWVSNLWGHYVYLVDAAKENSLMKQEISDLQGRLLSASEIEAENSRLRALLEMGSRWSNTPIAARVIATTPQANVNTIVIDKGWADGIKRDRPVMSGYGLVGRVRVLGEHTSTVLLITDASSAVDVIDSRSRVRGLLVGGVRETVLKRPVSLTQLEYVTHDSDLSEGDELITSGMDGIYPKGLPVGKVHDVGRNDFGLFEEAWVLPYSDMGQLEEVIVL